MPSTGHLAAAAHGHAAFLFVGDHLALDLLNTVVGQGDGRRELLADAASLKEWVAQASWEAPEVQALLAGSHRLGEWTAALEQVRDLRELGRELVIAWRNGSVTPPMLDRLHVRMRQVQYRHELQWHGHELGLRWVPELPGPQSMAGLLAVAVGELLAHARPQSVKSCVGAGCSLTFLDRTKGQRRLFCSAALCGNRAKVAAFRARQRGTANNQG
ncbi:CGNR zinc finger domain-containing protein [Schlegelella sp. S2-27]|uniref:CGNR zinc finger domain-containing protein n=1 Tax=Caldimonas mangrovi TaxID=2944811 RepID=A0ABT0YPF7_9BURK|nr:CGNR zinc finger domain-containing protein [Caldimonas mangrovi]MCM5679758.1 CGNR zinc finger domain-containing protein [Caldimonas mangrovi]